MKPCSKCKIPKPYSDFFIDKQKSDGLYSSCRGCAKVVKQAYSDTHRAPINARMKVYNKKRYAEASYKVIARVKVYDALTRTGKLTRPDSCQRCDKLCKPQAHHEDHTKPLDVMWLCTGCHGLQHSEMRGVLLAQ